MSKKRVAILGLNLSGIYAAKAAEDMGYAVKVYHYGRPSFPYKTLWQYWIPADIRDKISSSEISLIPEGNSKNYMSLQWGRIPNNYPESNFPEKERIVKGYNPEKIWNILLPESVKYLKHSIAFDDIYDWSKQYDHVFQTFPSEESYHDQKHLVPFWTAILYDSYNTDSNKIWYNGTGEGYIVCRSNLWGDTYYEYPKYLPLEEIQRILLPEVFSKMIFRRKKEMSPFTVPYQPSIYMPDNLHFVGKWAEWNPKRLCYQVYDLVKEILNA
jgi:hypothetical protein